MGALAEAINPRRRILYLDIERLPGLARVWDQRTNFIPVSQWTRLPSLLCVAASWADRREVMFRAAWDDPDQMVRDVWAWLDEADILVTFNGDRFDIPHLRGAFLLAGLAPPSTFKSVDLFKIARQFGFESKSLAHLCHRLELPNKHGHYNADEAERALAGDIKAQRRMSLYNRTDVKIMKPVHRRLGPWTWNHPHVYPDSETPRCHCGSDKLERTGTYLAQVMEYAEYRCQDCGAPIKAGWVRRVALTRGVK